MTRSYENINYSLRPAKAVERKMLCEAFRRLRPFGRVEDYRYIGFGSTYFSDFVLFHKSLGMKNMLSIERDEENNDRFLFNRPFGCIEIEFGESTGILPTLPWNTRTIAWLDYDGKLSGNILADVKLFCSSAPPGSVIVVTVNSHPDRSNQISVDDVERMTQYRLQKLIQDVGEQRVPKDIESKDLAGWGKARTCRRIIHNEILQTLQERNGRHTSGNRIRYRQLFNLHYADGVKMLTVGGLLYDEGQESLVASCGFEDLFYVQLGAESYLIEVPSLTYREIRHLDTQLPVQSCAELDAPGIPKSHLEMYRQIYRYFPTFAEAEI